MDPERLGDQALHRQPGAQRGERVLEHHRDLPAIGPERRIRARARAHAVEVDGAGGRPDQPHDRAAEGRLAAAALADDAERLPGRERERHLEHGVDERVAHAAQQRRHGAHRPIAHDQIVDLEQLSHGRADGSARRARAPSG